MKWFLLTLSAATTLIAATAVTTPTLASSVSEVLRLCHKTPGCIVDKDPNGHDLIILGPKGGIVICPATGGCYVGNHAPGRATFINTGVSSSSAIKAAVQGNAQ